MSSDTESQPLLPRQEVDTPNSCNRRFGIGCILTVVFLQSLFVVKLDILLDMDLDYMNIDIGEPQTNAALVIIGVIAYVAPIGIAVYVDAFAGCYNGVFVGLCIKTLGNMLSLIVSCVCERVDCKANPSLKMALFGIFFMGDTLVGASLFFAPAALMVLICQQAKQTRDGVSSLVTWLAFLCALGTAISSIAFSHDMINIRYYEPSPFFRPILHAVMFGVDALSLSIFIFGKRSYRMVSTDAGRQSFRRLIQIGSRYVRCLRKPADAHSEDGCGVFPSAEEVQLRKALGRQKLRKLVFLVPLACTITAAVMCLCIADRLLYYGGRYHGLWVDRDLIDLLQYGLIIVVLPIIECIRKKTGFHFWQNNPANQLKCFGFCFILSAVCLLMSATLMSFIELQTKMPSQWWAIPQVTLKGLACIVLGINGAVFCYHESPRGLSTFVLTLVMCLVLITFPLNTLVRSAISKSPNETRFDIIGYATAGGLIAILLVIFIPVSIWYVRTERKIQEINNRLEVIAASTKRRERHMESVLVGSNDGCQS